MKQLTKEQAIALAESGEWKDWTNEKIVKFQLYQEKLCMPFNVFHRAVGEVLGRPVFTHEFANWSAIVDEYEGERPAPTFEEIMNLIPEEKRILIGL
jgi:hypothetical protein